MESLAVVDASFAFRLLPINPFRDNYWAIVNRLVAERVSLVAPSLWIYETTSAVTRAVRSDQISENEGFGLVRAIVALPVRLVEPDNHQCDMAAIWTFRLRRAAAYDSFYLSLAESFGCDLWTADQRLHNAVGLPWVRLVGDNR